MKINRQCILRLSRYKNALSRLRALGFVKVFSDNLADAVGVTPAMVRKDFSLFGITGNKRGGYEIEILLDKLNVILGKDQLYSAIVVGAGHIGTALMKYRGFEQGGIRIAAAFDIDPSKQQTASAVPVYPVDQMRDYIREHKIRLGIIAVPDIASQQVADMMVQSGIKGILNFAPIRLRVPDECVVNNVNLEVELENLIYFVNVRDRIGVDNS